MNFIGSSFHMLQQGFPNLKSFVFFWGAGGGGKMIRYGCWELCNFT